MKRNLLVLFSFGAVVWAGSPAVAQTGACCDTLNGVCSEGILAADCVGDQRVWTDGSSCAEIVCEVTHAAIPTVSEWGLILMTLIGLAAGTILLRRRNAYRQVED